MTVSTSILLTGGTGFFGRALLRKWQADETSGAAVARVTVLSRDAASFLVRYPEFFDLPWLSFRSGDIRDPSSLPRGERFTHILHAATDSTLGPQMTPLTRYQQILDGTRNLLDFAVAIGARRFLLTSSGGVYGPQPPEVDALAEDWSGCPDLRNPANAYSQGKRAAEHLCALYQDAFGLEVVIARCFAFVGPDLPLDVHFAIGNFIRDALTREAITVSGDGTPLRTYLDQADLAHWLLTLLDQGRPGEAYNVGSDEVISIAELAYRVRDLLAPDKAVLIHGGGSDAQGRNRYIPDIRKAQRELGLAVTIPLAEAIRRTGAAHRGEILL
ncbi:MAG: NAD(P)-dependent oxidoreductase [Chromatiaceae bacterium]